MLVYVDTSALIKVIVKEAEAQALDDFLNGVEILITSRITQVELTRAARRTSTDAQIHIDAVLGQLIFRELTSDVSMSAGRLMPVELRSQDAIHLATALELGRELDAFLTYDKRLAAAAAQHGLSVVAPA